MPPRAPARRQSPPIRPANTRHAAEACTAGLPTPEQIAAEVRHRPIGAVVADICRDLGIMPSHPLWRELSAVVIRYGGSLAKLVKDICDRAGPLTASRWPPGWPASLPSPAPSGTGPP